jgi:hypothetical protein
MCEGSLRKNNNSTKSIERKIKEKREENSIGEKRERDYLGEGGEREKWGRGRGHWRGGVREKCFMRACVYWVGWRRVGPLESV